MAPVVNSPRECCIKTVEHSGTAGGTTEIIAGVPTYVSRPQSQGESRKIVLFFADVYGPFFLNSQLLMDYWASHGYLVLALDYFEGDTIDKHLHKLGPHYSLVEDYVPAKMTRAKEITPLWIDAIKEQFGTADTKWLIVGYCFGGPFVMDCLAEDWVTAGAFAHPACLEEAHFLRLKQPLLLSLAEDDITFSKEFREKAEGIMAQKKATYHIQIFSGTVHGFALSGNVEDPVAKWAKEQSAATIKSWFDLACSRT
ncbi:hypothetical protein POSPLADRAFT_1051034 [Postia placenta MAD-698-R-SB12]|uniref:Dienelactone hydrolase domain-containing protein n=1 Tax=Postia placenta MAD-698-R-SB12 TaxID=670580 RepID=A0A1X6NEJ9_9APHY|nr:hypothetical protein POSPLADRAFT_1051034 [Postia placenta MAD-698-R-SB12]OSX66866.1 hypothetical protein POSPLADRAFT_1051034 [Postia placenta MAD-698-R-SB12]